MKKLALWVLTIGLALSTVSSAEVLREVWWQSLGIEDAVVLVDSGTAAEQTDVLDEPAWDTLGDYYVAKMSGWLTIPATGEYTFYIASDDYSRLWVSADDNPKNADVVAYVDGWTGAQSWTSYDSQKSAPMSLTEGQVVAVYGIMQEGSGGDNCAFGWTGPGIDAPTLIPGASFTSEYEVTAATMAGNPSPADGATGVVDAVVSWTLDDASVESPVFNVYGGTDPEALELMAEGIPETSFNAGSAGVKLDFLTTYYWKVTQPGGEGKVWSFTTETGAPIITSIAGDAVAPEADARLAVEATSILGGELTYQWYRKEVEMMGIVLTDVPLPEGVAAALDVTAVSVDDEGQYYCVVTNDLGSTTSDMVWLDVQVGLIHRWTFDESANGVTLPDVVGGADATLINATGAATIANGQATMGNDGSQSSGGGTGDYIDLPNGLLSPLTQMTLECWTTWDGNASIWQRVFDLGTSNGGEDSSSGGDASTFLMACPENGSGVLQIEYRNLGASSIMPINDNGIMSANEELMITIVHDDVAGVAKCFLNGTIVGAYATPVMLNEFVDNNLWLGRSQWGDPLYCGSFNELRIYDTARSAAEVAADYLAGPDTIAEPAAECDVALAGDRNGDCVIDFVDAAITADEWLVQSLEEEE